MKGIFIHEEKPYEESFEWAIPQESSDGKTYPLTAFGKNEIGNFVIKGKLKMRKNFKPKIDKNTGIARIKAANIRVTKEYIDQETTFKELAEDTREERIKKLAEPPSPKEEEEQVEEERKEEEKEKEEKEEEDMEVETLQGPQMIQPVLITRLIQEPREALPDAPLLNQGSSSFPEPPKLSQDPQPFDAFLQQPEDPLSAAFLIRNPERREEEDDQ